MGQVCITGDTLVMLVIFAIVGAVFVEAFRRLK